MIFALNPTNGKTLAVWDEVPDAFTVEVASGLRAFCDRTSSPRSSPRVIGFELASWELSDAETAAAYRRIMELLGRGDDVEMLLSELTGSG